MLNDGRTFDKFVENALGTLARPMSDADLEEKFRSLTDGVLPQAQADRLIKLCWSAAQLADAARSRARRRAAILNHRFIQPNHGPT